MKKLLSLLLVLTMMLSLVGGGFALADETEPVQSTEEVTAPADPGADDVATEPETKSDSDAAPETSAADDPEETPAVTEDAEDTDPADADTVDTTETTEGEAPTDETPVDEAPVADPAEPGEDSEDGTEEEASATVLAEETETQEAASDPALADNPPPEDPPKDKPAGQPKEFKAAGGLVDGQNYVIVIGSSALNSSAGLSAVTIKDGKVDKPDDSIIWTASTGDGGGMKLTANKGTGGKLSAADGKLSVGGGNNWKYTADGLGYTSKGNIVGFITASGGVDKGGTPVTLYTDGPQAGSYSSVGGGGDVPAEPSTGGSTSGADDGSFKEWKGPVSLTEDTDIAIKLGDKTLEFSPGPNGIKTVDATVADGVLTNTKSSLTASPAENGLNFFTKGGPSGKTYIIVKDGKLATSNDPVGSWTINEGGGPSSITYSYTDADGTVWYLTQDADGNIIATKESKDAKKGDMYSPQAPDGPGGGGPGGPGGPGGGSTADADAPTFTQQPEAIHFVYEGSDYDAPTYTVKAALPEGSTADSITLQWFVEGQASGEPEVTKGKTATSTITIPALQGKKSGVYPVYAQATCTVDGEAHSSSSFTTNFIVCKGVKTNSVLTFSDVHEVWDNVGQAVYDTILAENGLIPALVIATGDYNNAYVAGWSDENIQKCIDTMITRIKLQLGGIDTVWVSGNHDNGYATGFTNANKEADLGLDEDNYYDKDGGISGTGIIYDSRNAPSADSSLANEGLIVIGINYEDIGSLGAYSVPSTEGRPSDPSKLDYGTADGPDNTVYKYLEKALEKAAKNYNGELVIISTHAGVHTLGVDPDSAAAGASAWSGGNDYSVTNSAAVVHLVNSYVEKYGMNILWLFGHDHSKGEGEFYKVPGDKIISTVSYDKQTTEEIELKFAYAHAGYITDNIGGKEVYSFLTWDDKYVTRESKVADGEQTAKDELTFDMKLQPAPKGAKALESSTDATYIAPDDVVKAITDAAAKKGYKPVAYYDVDPVWSDGTAASDADVAANGGVVVTLPLPKDVTSASDIIVLHKTAKGVEIFEAGDFIFADDGVRLKAGSLSPFAIAVKSATASQTSKAPVKSSSAKGPGKAPKTGDDSNIALWAVLLILCGGTAVAILPRKKHN